MSNKITDTDLKKNLRKGVFSLAFGIIFFIITYFIPQFCPIYVDYYEFNIMCLLIFIGGVFISFVLGFIGIILIILYFFAPEKLKGIILKKREKKKRFP